MNVPSLDPQAQNPTEYFDILGTNPEQLVASPEAIEVIFHAIFLCAGQT